MDFRKGDFHFSGKEMFYQNLLDGYSKIFYISLSQNKKATWITVLSLFFLFCLNEAFAVP